jgi:hypothetical protein
MNFVPRIEREPTPRERAYLEALAAGERRPSISGQAGHMCRRFGWCEALYRSRDGEEVVRSGLPRGLDGVALVRAGYRLVGYVLTVKGERVLRGVRVG